MELRLRMVIESDGRTDANAAHWLAAELQRAGAAVAPVMTEPPSGTKSGTVATVGEWVVKGLLSAATLNAVAQIVVAGSVKLTADLGC